MIKVAITGGGTETAGELLRILTHHPDVIIEAVAEPAMAGRYVAECHHGLTGETDVKFCNEFDPAKTDVVIVCRHTGQTRRLLSDDPENPEMAHPDEPHLKVMDRQYPQLRYIDLSGAHRLDHDRLGLVYGLSEIYRKPMVRGARHAVVPSAIASVALTALYPLASHLLLNDDIDIQVSAHRLPLSPEYIASAQAEIAAHLGRCQQSFTHDVRISPKPEQQETATRALRITIDIPASITAEDAASLYEGIYDDHNFTFLQSRTPAGEDVNGTERCIIALSNPDRSTLRIEAAGDCLMRGGAGEAVHVLNLLFGLHERTGLNLKATF